MNTLALMMLCCIAKQYSIHQCLFFGWCCCLLFLFFCFLYLMQAPLCRAQISAWLVLIASHWVSTCSLPSATSRSFASSQYLYSHASHLYAQIHEYVKPEKFDHWKKVGDDLGFMYTASGKIQLCIHSLRLSHVNT
jgi:hypothetical protein